MTESERISSHLALVEELLRARDVSQLSSAQRARRLASLNDLRVYWKRGVFPSNRSAPEGRVPFFIDDDGVPCAVGQLMIASGHADLAARVRAGGNERYLDEIDDAAVAAWIEDSGFSLGELRLIQPSYRYTPQYEDPILEAAFLVDVPGFDEAMAKRRLVRGSAQHRAMLNAALRALAPTANQDFKPRDDDRRSVGVYYEPPPRRSNGMAFLGRLLAEGADPNDRADGRPSIMFEARDPEVIRALERAGGVLNDGERLIRAMENGDLEQVRSLAALKSAWVRAEVTPPPVNPKRPGHRLLAGLPLPLHAVFGGRLFGVPAEVRQEIIPILLDAGPADLHAIDEIGQPLIAVALGPDLPWLVASGFSIETQAEFDACLQRLLRLSHHDDLIAADLTALVLQRRDLFATSTLRATVAKGLVDHARDHQRRDTFTFVDAVATALGARGTPPFLMTTLLQLEDNGEIPNVQAMREEILDGANLNIPKRRMTPLSFAAGRKHGALFMMLLDNGATLHRAVYYKGCPLLAVAVETDNVPLALFLRTQGQSTNDLYDSTMASCAKPEGAGSVALVNQKPISSMKMSPEMKAALSLPAEQIDQSAVRALLEAQHPGG